MQTTAERLAGEGEIVLARFYPEGLPAIAGLERLLSALPALIAASEARTKATLIAPTGRP